MYFSIFQHPFPELVSSLLDKVEAELDRGKRAPVIYRFGTVYIILTVQFYLIRCYSTMGKEPSLFTRTVAALDHARTRNP